MLRISLYSTKTNVKVKEIFNVTDTELQQKDTFRFRIHFFQCKWILTLLPRIMILSGHEHEMLFILP